MPIPRATEPPASVAVKGDARARANSAGSGRNALCAALMQLVRKWRTFDVPSRRLTPVLVRARVPVRGWFPSRLARRLFPGLSALWRMPVWLAGLVVVLSALLAPPHAYAADDTVHITRIEPYASRDAARVVW